MANYRPLNINPQRAPKLASWYLANKDLEYFSATSYFTVAVRYYIATNGFLSIGSIPSINARIDQSHKDECFRIYLTKTKDILSWLETLKKQKRNALGMITYILENSISISEEESSSVPPIIELELRLDKAIEGKEPEPVPVPETEPKPKPVQSGYDKNDIVTIQEIPISTSESAQVPTQPKEKTILEQEEYNKKLNQLKDSKNINIMNHPIFQGYE